MRLLLASAAAAVAVALDNGLARIPARGFNSWYAIMMNPSETYIRATVAAMQKFGLPQLGYTNINLDDGIVQVDRDASGNLQADPKGFPNGFKSVSDWLATQNLTFGVYTDRGTQTCGGRAGAAGHEAQDAAWYAEQGFSYVKEDSCNAVQDHPTAYHEYSLMRDGLNATGKPIIFSLCGWNPWYAPVGASLGNSWRTGPDDTNWHGVLVNLDIIEPLGIYAGPGGWNDPCLLLGHDVNGNIAVTDLQGRAQFTMWNIVGAPLLLSQDIITWTPYQVETYTNAEVLAISGDPLGRVGQRLQGGPFVPGGGDGNTPVVVAECATNDALGGQAVTSQQFQFNNPTAGFLYNGASNQCVNADDCGSGLIVSPCVTSGGTCSGPTSYANEVFSFGADGAAHSAMPGNLCVTSNGVGSQATLAPCAPGSAGQAWAYNASSSTISNGAGLCLSVGSFASVANIWGRPLADGSWAVAFVNVGPSAVNATCDAACLGVTGWEPEQALSVRDLWAHAALPSTTAGAGISVTGLAADGGVQLFRLTPVF